MAAAASMRDRYLGCVLGAALGDALGKLTELIDYDQILFRYGPQGVTEPPARALFTDDTQMAIATARALLDAGGKGLAEVMDAIVRYYLRWYDQQNSPVHRRAPGLSVIDALARIHRGVPYAAAADGGANDAIVVTRVMPVALRYRGDPVMVIDTASEISRITHGHPAAVTAGAAAALFVEFALGDLPPTEWFAPAISLLRRHCSEAVRDVTEAIRTAERTVGWDPVDAMERHFRQRPGEGGGWSADEAVGMALTCFLAMPADYVGAVRLAANAPGLSDTDGIAFVTGALSGARNGVGAIPPDWIERLEEVDVLRQLANDLYEARAAELPDPGSA